MERFGIIVHGGAGPDSSFIQQHVEEIEKGICRARDIAYRILEEGASAVDAAEAAVRVLEDDPLFNAGRGSALNAKGGVEMDAAIMNGETLSAGAVGCLQSVKNPVSLARAIMDRTAHVLIVGDEALQLAHRWGFQVENDSYFVTPHQYEVYLGEQPSLPQILRQRTHGTVGAVAIDKNGHLAAATSTGGTEHSLPGRVGDSCIIGAGCYANNDNCAVSGTGDGELLMTRVVAYSVVNLFQQLNDLDAACKQVIHPGNKLPGDAGVISLSKSGDMGIHFNTDRMPRGWKRSDGTEGSAVYK